jgi:hypothetical protein
MPVCTVANVPTACRNSMDPASQRLWVHVVLPRFAARNATAARALLAGTGLGCAIVGAILTAEHAMTSAVAAAVGFGVVHVPAAFILALKCWRSRSQAGVLRAR